ncbi:methyltransferase domain-containing protein [Streptacidiphilus sp. PB12-B1b]|uniref:SAM-dependent methyltransferase n=1 Tax=Streptacidiphilus sp. PB12-B1b TaxID=2705012 RepID=UPI0015F7CF21|nr:SAM-dependent methyltransferase [Streptacidiphilus sp. PB12-B1b]QMU76703.1 methyltransferase domain-containing protein [Streptacidiphilus sp. PB12-B1b]
MSTPTPEDYFTRMYRDADDPWQLGNRWYEQRKYALTVAALPRERYRSGFEPACSAGVLSGLLADRCDRLLSCDRSPRAVAAARARLAGRGQVRVEQRLLPEQWPDERFDLVVLSEFLYYLGPDGLRDVLGRAVASLEPGGSLVAVHWRPPVAEHSQTGDAVHRAVRGTPGLVRIASHAEPDFLLDVLVRSAPDGPVDPAGLSVAAAEGLR